MSWLRIEDSFMEHNKIASLSDKDLRVYMRLLCFCARRRSGLIQTSALKEVPGLTRRRIDRYIEVGLLDNSLRSWEIHDWKDYQPTDFTAAERMARHRSKAATPVLAEPEIGRYEVRNNGVTNSYPPSRPVRTKDQDLVVEAVDNGLDKTATTGDTTHRLPRYIDARTTACRAGMDGECFSPDCPQLRDGEPLASGRHCPLDAIPAHGTEGGPDKPAATSSSIKDIP